MYREYFSNASRTSGLKILNRRFVAVLRTSVPWVQPFDNHQKLFTIHATKQIGRIEIVTRRYSVNGHRPLGIPFRIII